MNLLKTLATIGSMTMLSRITGLLREMLIAHAFGATAYSDAYNIAFRIPNFLRRIFAEGAFSQAFVPILSEYHNQKGQNATKSLVDAVGTLLTWALVLTSILGVIAAPAIVYALASGYVDFPEKFNATVVMTRIMFPYIALISLVALAGGILNTWREFRIPAFTPVLFNLASIFGSVVLVKFFQTPIYALAVAVVLGGILQLAIQFPYLMKIGMLPRISLRPLQSLQDPGVKRVLRNMAPAIFAVSASQISILINTNIASRLVTGSVSWLTYADRLMEFPTALLGVALGTILLPSLSRAHSQNDHEEYSSLLDWGLRLTFLLALPAAVGLATLSIPITAVLFHNGKFDTTALIQTSHALIAYGVGLIGLILVKILAPGFYARQNIKTPVKIAVGVMIAVQLMNLIFIPRLAHVGLALSVGLGACFNAGFLFFLLRRHGIYEPKPGWFLFFAKQFVALVLMAGVALFLSAQFDWIAMQSHSFYRALSLAGVLISCMTIYFASLLAMGFRFRDFKRIEKP
ncbi:putative peptidoglycan lipid II flippase [Oxalobacteraceae bacterium GrIS 1.18]